jgi:RNA polymerase sigma-70 factor (ECF subfamily)
MVPEHRRLTEKFVAACATGNLDGLLEVLDPQVSGQVDILARLVLSGADRVARNLLVYVGPGATLVSCPAGAQPVLLSFRDRKLNAVLQLTIADDRITDIHALADPARLDLLGAHLGARP